MDPILSSGSHFARQCCSACCSVCSSVCCNGCVAMGVPACVAAFESGVWALYHRLALTSLGLVRALLKIQLATEFTIPNHYGADF